MTVANEIIDTNLQLEKENTELRIENSRLKTGYHSIIAITHAYEGPEPSMWDIEIIATKAVLNQ